ncbi:hypothetical protein M3Y95_01018700 [Aphelenchoides besseyi]|nr:hypothetical protein M3Y95_01018700 [Aphelenchoides besseyi]
MGCSPSSARTASVANKSRRNSTEEEIDEATRRLLVPPPNITVSIGNGVAPIPDESQAIIFIFGSAGSEKGKVTQDLSHEFDFITISVEDIVFSYLPNKVANTVSNTVEIQTLLRRDHKIISLDWILNMISAKLSTSTSQRFIIDIVPELASMIRTEAFAGLRHDEQLANFERRHHIMMAVELYVADEGMLLERKTEGTAAVNKIDPKELSPELSAFMKGIDESDKGRLEKRLESFHRCADPFLAYFRDSHRVVRLDLRVPNNPGILPSVRQVFTDFGFARNNDFIRVVLFVTSERQMADVDLDYYRLRKVRLSDVSQDSDETMSQQIRALRRYIYRTAQPNENFLAILNCLNQTDYAPTRRINFIENRSTFLDFYIRNRRKRAPTNRCKMNFRAITSTTQETCLFPETMSTKLCKKIGYIFGEKLNLSESGSRAPSQLSNALIDLPASPTIVAENTPYREKVK